MVFTFQDLDTNKDGFVSVEEYITDLLADEEGNYYLLFLRVQYSS